jgi:hypothetical protein
MFYEMAEEAKTGEGAPDTKRPRRSPPRSTIPPSASRTCSSVFLIHGLSGDRGGHDHASHALFGRAAQSAGAQYQTAAFGLLYSHANHFRTFHFYMLLNLVLLARTAKSFEDALTSAFPEDGEARETFRMRIENTLFVQLLVGRRLEREGLNAKLL